LNNTYVPDQMSELFTQNLVTSDTNCMWIVWFFLLHNFLLLDLLYLWISVFLTELF
jgi:hypothetical protein